MKSGDIWTVKQFSVVWSPLSQPQIDLILLLMGLFSQVRQTNGWLTKNSLKLKEEKDVLLMLHLITEAVFGYIIL